MNSSNKQRHVLWQRITISSFLLLFLVLGLFSSVTLASTVGEEFASTETFDKGSVVSLRSTNPRDIELTTLSNNEYIFGVVNDSGDNLVTYSKDNSEVSVSLAGEVEVFVTDAGGDISKGDFIGASWIEGIGMKANTSDEQRLLGVALEDFNSGTASEYGEIETPDGSKDVKIGSILIRLLDKDASGGTEFNESTLEGVLSSIAGSQVSLARVIAVSMIFLTSVAIAGFFVSTSMRSSFISLGRNPRASTAIYRSLLHVTVTSSVVILIGTALSYVVLIF